MDQWCYDVSELLIKVKANVSTNVANKSKSAKKRLVYP